MNGATPSASLPAAHRRPALTDRGFSMIEMLMVIAILAILFTFIYKGFVQLNRYYTAENVKAASQQSVRTAVEMMIQDVRLAGLDPLGTSGARIEVASPTLLHFTADVDMDGVINGPFENMVYERRGNNLEQTNQGQREILLENISNLTFAYFDNFGAEIPASQLSTRLEDIRAVGVSLTINRPAGRSQEVSRTYTTQLRCRNL